CGGGESRDGSDKESEDCGGKPVHVSSIRLAQPSLSPDARVRQTPRRIRFRTAKFPMDLEYSPDERAFRDEVREFVRRNLPADLAAKVHEGKRLSRDDFLRWHR